MPKLRRWLNISPLYRVALEALGYALPGRLSEVGLEFMGVGLEQMSHNHNPGRWRVARDNPSHKWVRIAAFSIPYMFVGIEHSCTGFMMTQADTKDFL